MKSEMMVQRRMLMGRCFVPVLTLFATLGSPTASASAQAMSFIAGIVADAASGQPLPGATVSIVGTDVRTLTDEHGQFLVARVPADATAVRFEAPGYAAVVEELPPSLAEFFQVRLDPLVAVLDEILAIARSRPPPDGPPRLSSVRFDEHPRAGSLLDLLRDQIPGVSVARSGEIGAGVALRLRGPDSFLGEMAPDIYLDGVRINAPNTPSGGLHVLEILPASDVARIQVFKGTASATGAIGGGADGVIWIETYRGAEASAR